jgi:hypothetical protein
MTMTGLRKIAYGVLVVLNVLLALTAFAGGIGLLTGLNAPPVEQLQGSVFKDFTVPGLALFVIVGGSALLASLLLIRRNRFAILAAVTVGIIIMFFEFVEVMAIGSPPGIAQTLQIFYYGLGVVIEIMAVGVWFIDLLRISP